MKQFLKHIGILLACFLILATIVSVGGLWSLSKSTFYKSSFVTNGLKKSNYDYIVLGSSVGLTTLNTQLIDSINHIKGVNLSMDDTGMSSHYLMLQHFLAEGKTTNYCVLAPGIGSLQNRKAQSGNNDYRFLMFTNRVYVQDYFNAPNQKQSQDKILAVSRYLPFVGVSYYSTEILFPSLAALINPNKRNRFDANGNYTYPKRNKKFSEENKKTRNVELSHPYLEKIEKLCLQNNIELIYYFSPIWNQEVNYPKSTINVIDHTSILSDASLFYDDIHVNSEGRKMISKMFASEFNGIILQK